jgi:hypothetical protein
MDFPLERCELYDLPKDLLIQLIMTIQKQYKPENIKEDKLTDETKKYILETFKRKTIIIKQYLEKYEEVIEVLPYVKTFKVLSTDSYVILSISFHDNIFVRCTSILSNFGLAFFDKNHKPVYKYTISGNIAPSEEIFQESEMKAVQKYIDFVKFLNEKLLIKRLFDYLNVYTKRKNFED